MSTACDAQKIDALVEILTDKYAAVWNRLPSHFPAMGARLTAEQQIAKECEIDRILVGLPDTGDLERMSPDERAKTFPALKEAVLAMVTTGLGFPSDVTHRAFLKDCMQSADEFVGYARKFDPDMTPADIEQGIRNLMVFNSIQFILGENVRLTVPGFAYSMLYPFADNGLDETGVPVRWKQSFLRRLDLRLLGVPISKAARREKAVADLIEMIEHEFPRSQYAGVYSSMLAIHHAQQRSLALQAGPCPESKILRISIEKGGTSVLADGFLTGASLSLEQADFLFAYGAALQLIDDLQDIKEDRRNGHLTLFSSIDTGVPRDFLANRLLWLLQGVMNSAPVASQESLESFRKFMSQGSCLVVAESVARNPDYFSPEFVVMLEQYLPVRLSYVDSIKEKFYYLNVIFGDPVRSSLMSSLRGAAFS